MLMAMTIDFLAAMIGAKRVGASKYALIGAALGSVLGIFAGLIGIFIFPFVGAIAGEMIARKNFQQATKGLLRLGSGCCWGRWRSSRWRSR